jgi:hypothetical protein
MIIRLGTLSVGVVLASLSAILPFASAQDLVEQARLRAAIDKAAAERNDDQQLFRHKLEQLNARSEALRIEARFDLAAEVDVQIRDLLRSRDPQLLRVNDLKRRALESRLEAKHEDAELFEREANRLLRVVAKRYPPPATEDAPVQAEKSISVEVDLREEVARLAQQVEALTRIVEKLRDQAR